MPIDYSSPTLFLILFILNSALKENFQEKQETTHVPVMLEEVVHFLNIKKSGTYMDCTFGGGGHSKDNTK